MLNNGAAAAWFVAYWPIMYRFSRNVTPAGCGAFTLLYAGLWWKGISPFLLQRLQGSLNSSVAELAAKYKIKPDADYM